MAEGRWTRERLPVGKAVVSLQCSFVNPDPLLCKGALKKARAEAQQGGPPRAGSENESGVANSTYAPKRQPARTLVSDLQMLRALI
jgi:hypothetical protein